MCEYFRTLLIQLLVKEFTTFIAAGSNLLSQLIAFLHWPEVRPGIQKEMPTFIPSARRLCLQIEIDVRSFPVRLRPLLSRGGDATTAHLRLTKFIVCNSSGVAVDHLCVNFTI